MSDLTRWRVEIRYCTDETVASILKAHGIPRHDAVKLAEDTNEFLDHDVFYTEIVELPS